MLGSSNGFAGQTVDITCVAGVAPIFMLEYERVERLLARFYRNRGERRRKSGCHGSKSQRGDRRFFTRCNVGLRRYRTTKEGSELAGGRRANSLLTLSIGGREW